uniref:Uncharacterized protein n=1 Tax=Apteryx owenii TaxID=8824 RepID=A0A8B9NSK5_APTOW
AAALARCLAPAPSSPAGPWELSLHPAAPSSFADAPPCPSLSWHAPVLFLSTSRVLNLLRLCDGRGMLGPAVLGHGLPRASGLSPAPALPCLTPWRGLGPDLLQPCRHLRPLLASGALWRHRNNSLGCSACLQLQTFTLAGDQFCMSTTL